MKNKFKQIKDNHKKTKNEKFKLLKAIIKKSQELIIDINNINADTLMSINLKTDISEINMNNLTRKNLSKLYSRISNLKLFIEKSIIGYENSDFKKEILINLNILKEILDEIKPLDKIYDNKKLVIKKLNISKEKLEFIEKTLIIIEKNDLIYFEDIKKPQKKMMSDLLKEQRI